MLKTFRMKKMLDRLKREGRMNEVTEEDIEMMKKLDGKVGNDYNWESVVNGVPLVWIEEGETYVNIADCD